MNIYIGKKRKSAKKITFKKLLAKKLKASLIPIVDGEGRFDDKSASWIEIVHTNKDLMAQITITIGFEPEDDDELLDLCIDMEPLIPDYDKSTILMR